MHDRQAIRRETFSTASMKRLDVAAQTDFLSICWTDQERVSSSDANLTILCYICLLYPAWMVGWLVGWLVPALTSAQTRCIDY